VLTSEIESLPVGRNSAQNLLCLVGKVWEQLSVIFKNENAFDILHETLFQYPNMRLPAAECPSTLFEFRWTWHFVAINCRKQYRRIEWPIMFSDLLLKRRQPFRSAQKIDDVDALECAPEIHGTTRNRKVTSFKRKATSIFSGQRFGAISSRGHVVTYVSGIVGVEALGSWTL